MEQQRVGPNLGCQSQTWRAEGTHWAFRLWCPGCCNWVIVVSDKCQSGAVTLATFRVNISPLPVWKIGGRVRWHGQRLHLTLSLNVFVRVSALESLLCVLLFGCLLTKIGNRKMGNWDWILRMCLNSWYACLEVYNLKRLSKCQNILKMQPENAFWFSGDFEYASLEDFAHLCIQQFFVYWCCCCLFKDATLLTGH